MKTQALKVEFFGLVRTTRVMKDSLWDLETDFYEEIQFTDDASEKAKCEQRIFESQQFLIDSYKRMSEIRAAVTPETLKEWKAEWKANEKAVAAATETADQFISNQMKHLLFWDQLNTETKEFLLNYAASKGIFIECKA